MSKLEINQSSRQEKYLKMLFELNYRLRNQQNEEFILKDFINYSRIDKSFIDACIKMGLVIKYKHLGINRYLWDTTDMPTLEDAEFIIELVNDFAEKRKGGIYDDFNKNILSIVRK